MNSSVGDAERRQRAMAVARDVLKRDDLVAPSRAMLKEGPLTKLRRHKWGSQCHRSPRQAYLFSDLLVLHTEGQRARVLPLHALILITNGVLHSPVCGTQAVSSRRCSAAEPLGAAAGSETCSTPCATSLSSTSTSISTSISISISTAAAAAAALTDAAGSSAATSLPATTGEESAASCAASVLAPACHANAAAAAAAERTCDGEDLSPFDMTLAALGVEPALLSAEDLAATLVVAVAGDGNQILLRAQSERERDEWVGGLLFALTLSFALTFALSFAPTFALSFALTFALPSPSSYLIIR